MSRGGMGTKFPWTRMCLRKLLHHRQRITAPKIFGTDQLFEDAAAVKEFVEQATGEAGVLGGGGEDGASDFARDKTKKGGRKFTSCHYVAAHVQLLSIAPHRRSRFATTRQVPPLDKTTADQVAADGEGSTGLRAQTYTRAQLRTLKPCSRCKAQHKGVLYCLRLGHISVPLSALRKKEGMGGKPLGPRALLLIGDIRLLRPQLSAPIFQEGLDRLSGLRPQLFSGIFQFDSAALRGSMTIGRVRESLRYNSSLPTEELSVVQSTWQQTVVSGYLGCHFELLERSLHQFPLSFLPVTPDNGSRRRRDSLDAPPLTSFIWRKLPPDSVSVDQQCSLGRDSSAIPGRKLA